MKNYFLILFFLPFPFFSAFGACAAGAAEPTSTVDEENEGVVQMLRPFPEINAEIPVETPFPYKPLSPDIKRTAVFLSESAFAFIGDGHLAQHAVIGPCRPCVAVAVYAGQKAICFHQHMDTSRPKTILQQIEKFLAANRDKDPTAFLLTQKLNEYAQKKHKLTAEEQYKRMKTFKDDLETLGVKKENITARIITFVHLSALYYTGDSTFVFSAHLPKVFSTCFYQEGIFAQNLTLSQFTSTEKFKELSATVATQQSSLRRRLLLKFYKSVSPEQAEEVYTALSTGKPTEFLVEAGEESLLSTLAKSSA